MLHGTAVERLKDYFTEHREQILDRYLTFLQLATISADPSTTPEMEAATQWLCRQLESIGLDVEVWETETAGHPILYGEWMGAGPEAPTLLLYNHYDVQPVDPLVLWRHLPFTPHVDGDGRVFARGAQDNKGQCLYVIEALRFLLERRELLNVNLKWIIEGEEEIGSPGLSALIEARADRLKNDYLLAVDGGLLARRVASISLGARGLVALELTVRGSKVDLHSGTHGGIAYNPNRALVEMLASLYDAEGRVAVPGFYDEVQPIDESLRSRLAIHFDEEHYFLQFGGRPIGGEREYSPYERAWLRPTLEINGLSGGYSGEGVKTVIPAEAHAKITCRLVANQEPSQIAEKVKRHLLEQALPGLEVEVTLYAGSGKAIWTDPNSPLVAAVSQAFIDLYGAPCLYMGMGGSIPIIERLAAATGGEPLVIGMGLDEDDIHAPNEHFDLERMCDGFILLCRMMSYLARTH